MRDLYQGTSSLVPDPTFSRVVNRLKEKLFSSLPKASAQLPILERSALKEGYSNPENALGMFGLSSIVGIFRKPQQVEQSLSVMPERTFHFAPVCQ